MFDPKARHNKREGLTLETVGQLTTGSNQKVAWKCDKHPKHKWNSLRSALHRILLSG